MLQRYPGVSLLPETRLLILSHLLIQQLAFHLAAVGGVLPFAFLAVFHRVGLGGGLFLLGIGFDCLHLGQVVLGLGGLDQLRR